MDIILLTICIGFIGAVFVRSVLSKDLVIIIVSGIGLILLFIVLFAQVYVSIQGVTQAQIEQGQYYIEECDILETDIEINLVYPHTHKLQCGPLIVYVDIKSYHEAVKAYQDSLLIEEK
ncbi:hypothetical protein [Providencia rettgeri]|uniref:hypothetical protein n=1 Tax=Providencia rettgeri TaxID=587 RepID=UPI001EFD46B2|nr:hypothetical protein [Providencia rettgeri]MCG9528653.1 hypothetical protein [Providencia rettgeri]